MDFFSFFFFFLFFFFFFCLWMGTGVSFFLFFFYFFSCIFLLLFVHSFIIWLVLVGRLVGWLVVRLERVVKVPVACLSISWRDPLTQSVRAAAQRQT